MANAIFKRVSAVLLALLLVTGLSAPAFAADSSSLRLEQQDESGSTPFYVTNMFPGDSETKDFTVKVDHSGPITLYYHADIRPGSEKLAEVMMVRIELPGKGLTLYNGLMRDMPSALAHQLTAGETEVLYRITVYLDTSVGNDYQYKTLIADFRWWYLENTGGDPSLPDPEPGSPTPVSVKLAAEKVMDGQYPRGSEFVFVLCDETGKAIQTVNNRDGSIEFDTLTFDRAGTYLYTIAEIPGDDSSIDYDPSVYSVTVTVAEEQGLLSAAVTYEKDAEVYKLLPRFVNKTVGTDPPEDPDNPKTGDDSGIELYLPLFAGSALALFLLLLLTRRKKEEKTQ